MMMFITESGYHSSHGDDSSLSNGESPPPFTFDSPDSIDRVTNRVSSMNLNNSSCKYFASLNFSSSHFLFLNLFGILIGCDFLPFESE